jgi:hypothetical protein
MTLTNTHMQKTIVVLSPEPWGKMLVSKMHFSLELAKRGYKVFFVNPPRKLEEKVLAVAATEGQWGNQREGQAGNQADNRGDDPAGNLVVIKINEVPGMLFFRHKLFFLFRLINRRYIKAIKKITGPDIDQVWCFNPNVFVDLRLFGAKKSILMLYDLYGGKHVWRAAASADAIVTISQVILDEYQKASCPKLLVQHGLGKHFADKAVERLRSLSEPEPFSEPDPFSHPDRKEDPGPAGGGKRKVGYTGNLLRPGMNTALAKQIIDENREIEFHFWGPYSKTDNNVTGASSGILPEHASLIDFLQQQQHVFLHGVVTQEALAENLFKMDAFLFIYSPAKEVNKASNAHKLLEYISTGKTVISTSVSNYAGTDLLVMSDAEQDLPTLFTRAMGDLTFYNSREKQKARINFALDNTYSSQVDRILQFARS